MILIPTKNSGIRWIMKNMSGSFRSYNHVSVSACALDEWTDWFKIIAWGSH